MNTIHPRDLELHDALGAASDQAREPPRACRPGLTLTFLLGLTFLLTQILEYSRIGFAPYTDAFGTIFFCLTGLHGAHVFVGLTLLLFATIRSYRGHYSPEAPPRGRDSRDLLALRGRDVDRGLHDGLHPLASGP